MIKNQGNHKNLNKIKVQTIIINKKNNKIMKKLPKTIDYKGYKIPTEKTDVAIKERRKIITDFYKKWFGENEKRKIKNVHLNRFIFVNNFSLKETRHWAAYSFQSTMTVLCLSYVLKNAVKTGVVPIKPNTKKQSKFDKMIIMECVVPELRPHVITAKLTVGILKISKDKIQYCLTAK